MDAALGVLSTIAGSDVMTSGDLAESKEAANCLCGICGLFGYDAMGDVATCLLVYLDDHGLRTDKRVMRVYVDSIRLFRAEPGRERNTVLGALGKLA